jgi:hypothetical protein
MPAKAALSASETPRDVINRWTPGTGHDHPT